MLNLLLRKDRYTIRREYTFRFINVLLNFTIIIFVIFLVLLFSLNLLVSTEKGIAENQLESVTDDANVSLRNEVQGLGRDLRNDLTIFGVDVPRYSEYISRIVSLQTKGLSIDSFRFNLVQNEDEGDILEIEVSGFSSTRDNLVSFANSLRSDIVFTEIDLPVSNLTQENDVSFRISMKTEGVVISKEYEKGN